MTLKELTGIIFSYQQALKRFIFKNHTEIMPRYTKPNYCQTYNANHSYLYYHNPRFAPLTGQQNYNNCWICMNRMAHISLKVTTSSDNLTPTQRYKAMWEVDRRSEFNSTFCRSCPLCDNGRIYVSRSYLSQRSSNL